MSKISLNGIGKSFEHLDVLDNLNLDIMDNELMVVLGSSGCGKTTMLNIISGLMKQDKGDLYIDDKLVNGAPPEKRPVGMVFQDYLLFPHLNVFENIVFGLKTSRFSKNKVKQIVNDTIEFLRIENLKRRYPRMLSGGEQQRVALARALTIEPEILLLDEPLSNLDAKTREGLRVELKSIQKKLGITTIQVTHDQTEAIIMADRIGILNNKKIEQIGRPDEIFFKPKTEFVASFVGSANNHKGHVTKVDRELKQIKVSFNDLEIIAICKNRFSVGDKVLTFIRPDDIFIMLNKHAISTQNVFKATIKEKILLGGIVRLKTLVEGEEFTVEVTRQISSELKLKSGKKVYLAFKPSSVHLIKNEFCIC